MQDKKINSIAITILSKPKMTRSDIAELVDLTLEAKPVAEMKDRMQLLIDEALALLNKLPKKKLQSKLQAVVSFMLEDL